MTKTFNIVALALLAAFATGCAKDDLNNPIPDNGGGKSITISVGMPTDANTRVAFDGDTKLTWQAGDQLTVARGGKSELFTLEGEGGTTSGSFTGTAPDAGGTGSYTITYPATATNMDGQAQPTNASTDHLKNYVRLSTQVADLATGFTLAMTSSILKFNLGSIPVDIGPLRRLDWMVEGANGTRSLSLDLTGCTTTADALTVYLGFLPTEMSIRAGGTVTLHLVGDKTYVAEATPTSGKSYEAGKQYTATMETWSAVKTNVMKMTVRVDDTNGLGFNIPFNSYQQAPADITVDWGDGTPVVTVPKETELTANDAFNHTYITAGTYTITITSVQTDATKPLIPLFNFGLNRTEANNPLKLISMNTPILNTMENTFGYCFQGCTSLTFVYSGLFANNPQVDSFGSCFNGCSSLASIPADLFAKNTQALSFSSCFQGCTSLTSIPEGLFANNTLAWDFSYCFYACSKLKLNEAIFDSPENKDRFADKNVDFAYCFYNTGTSLTAEERAKSIAPKLWEYEKGTATWTTNNCYTDCKASNTDPAMVPVAWGGSKP